MVDKITFTSSDIDNLDTEKGSGVKFSLKDIDSMPLDTSYEGIKANARDYYKPEQGSFGLDLPPKQYPVGEEEDENAAFRYSGAVADAFYRDSPQGRVLSYHGQGANQNWGAGSVKDLFGKPNTVVNNEGAQTSPMKGFNETFLRPFVSQSFQKAAEESYKREHSKFYRPTFMERVKLHTGDSFSQTLTGASLNVIGQNQKETRERMLRNWGLTETADEYKKNVVDGPSLQEEAFNNASDFDDTDNVFDTIKNGAAVIIGQFAGALGSPESYATGFVGPVGRGIGMMAERIAGKFAPKARPAIQRILEAAVSQGLVNTAVDPAVQTLNITASAQDYFDVERLAMAPVFGATFGATFQATGEALAHAAGKARAKGLIGEGEEGFFRTQEPTPEELAERNQAGKDTGTDPAPPVVPKYRNIHELAREVDPETFREIDRLKGVVETLRENIPYRESIVEAEKNRVGGVLYKEVQKAEQALQEVRTQIVDTEGQLTDLIPKREDALRRTQELLDSDSAEGAAYREYAKLVDLQEDAAHAYEHARSLLPEKTPQEKAADEIKAFEKARKEKIERDSKIEEVSAMKKEISDRVTEDFVRAGVFRSEAEQLGPLVAAHYHSRAERFQGRLGTAKQLFEKDFPEVKEGKEGLEPKEAELNQYAGSTAFKGTEKGFQNNSRLAKAVTLESRGMTPEQIMKETGWFKSPYDKKWRFEISDHDSALTDNWTNLAESQVLGDKTTSTLGDILNHPELFEAYPELKDVTVTKQRGFLDFWGSMQGWFDSEKNLLNITPNATDPHSVVLHEIQHWIQHREKFNSGGNQNTVLTKLSPEKIEKLFVEEISSLKSKIEEAVRDLPILKRFRKEVDLTEAQRLNELWRKGSDAYHAKENKDLDYNDPKRVALRNEYLPYFKLFEDIKEATLEEYLGTSKFSEVPKERRDLYFAISEALRDGPKKLDEAIANSEKKFVELQKTLTKLESGDQEALFAFSKENSAFKLYQRIAGEIEARDTEARMKMTPEERLMSEPYSSQGIDPEDAIVTFDDGSSASTSEPKFKEWFGDSKAVGEDGKPLTLYHGTSKDTNFGKFTTPKNGTWFTVDPESASAYAVDNDSRGLKSDDGRTFREVNTASRVMPVYLKAENPKAYPNHKEFNDAIYALGKENYRRGQAKLFDKLRQEGYDSVSVGNGKDQVWVTIKDSNQIKSIHNNGSFGKSGDILNQEGRKGSLEVTEKGQQNILRIFRNSDASTAPHELGHQWLEEFMEDARNPKAPDDLLFDAQIVDDFLGRTKVDAPLTRKQHEKFARSWERYLREGKAPSQELKNVFEKLKAWLQQVYQSVKDLNVPLTDEMRGVFDRLLATPEELANRPKIVAEEKAVRAKKAKKAPETVSEAPTGVSPEPAPAGAKTTETASEGAPRASEEGLGEGQGPGDGSLQNIEGTGEVKTMGYAKRRAIEAIASGLEIDLKDLPQYRAMVWTDEARKAVEYVDANPDAAERAALNVEPWPEGILPEALIEALEIRAMATEDSDLIRRLAMSRRIATERKTMAQRLAYAGRKGRFDISLVDLLNDVIDSRKNSNSPAVRKEAIDIGNKLKEFTDKNVSSTGDVKSILKTIECDY